MTVEHAFGSEPGAEATTSSTLYMLIRYVDMTPKQFVCGGDSLTTEFNLSDWNTLLDRLSDAHDFGDDPAVHCSYSLHMPYIPVDAGAPVVPSSEAGSPLCADRNPYLDNQARWLDGEGDQSRYPGEAPSWDVDLGYLDLDKTGNSQCHEREGQNVLFNDGHVKFEDHPNCGINNDNIWKYWSSLNPSQREMELDGEIVGYGSSVANSSVGDPDAYPQGPKDAFLVNEDQREKGEGPGGA